MSDNKPKVTDTSNLLRDTILNGINNLKPITPNTVKINESRFLKEHYVDLLASYIRGEQVPIHLWIENVAINPYQEVQVVKDNDYDTVLCTIPGLFDREKTVYPQGAMDGIGAVINDAESKNKVYPNSGNKLILDTMYTPTLPPKSKDMVYAKWQSFIEFYNINVDNVVAKPDTVSSESIYVMDSEDDDDDF